MPALLLSFKKNSNGRVMFHGFTAPNDGDAEKDLEGHAGVCPQFGPAYRDGKTIEVAIDVDTLPEFTEESIEEWLDGLIGDDGEDGDEEEDVSGGPEDEEEEDDEDE